MLGNRPVLGIILFLLIVLIFSCDTGLLGQDETTNGDTTSEPVDDVESDENSDDTLVDPDDGASAETEESEDSGDTDEPVVTVESIVSTFDTDVEDWTYVGDSGSTVTFEPEGGNPGGFLRHLENAQGINDWLVAPAKFLGDMSAYYGGTLRYDLRTNILSSPLNVVDDVKLFGDGITLYHHHGGPTTIDVWHAFSVELSTDGGWTVDSPGGPSATEDDILTVLNNLTAIHIRADYRSGKEEIDLDNFAIEPKSAE